MIQDNNNSSISKDRSICACEPNKEHFIGPFHNSVIVYSYVNTNAVVTIDAEHDGFMYCKVVDTSWGRKHV